VLDFRESENLAHRVRNLYSVTLLTPKWWNLRVIFLWSVIINAYSYHVDINIKMHLQSIDILYTMCIQERKSANSISPESRALPQVPGPASQVSRPRQPVGRPRLELPSPSHLPQASGEDDGLFLLVFIGSGVESYHVYKERIVS